MRLKLPLQYLIINKVFLDNLHILGYYQIKSNFVEIYDV